MCLAASKNASGMRVHRLHRVHHCIPFDVRSKHSKRVGSPSETFLGAPGRRERHTWQCRCDVVTAESPLRKHQNQAEAKRKESALAPDTPAPISPKLLSISEKTSAPSMPLPDAMIRLLNSASVRHGLLRKMLPVQNLSPGPLLSLSPSKPSSARPSPHPTCSAPSAMSNTFFGNQMLSWLFRQMRIWALLSQNVIPTPHWTARALAC
jgi:hypothetical protein